MFGACNDCLDMGPAYFRRRINREENLNKSPIDAGIQRIIENVSFTFSVLLGLAFCRPRRYNIQFYDGSYHLVAIYIK